ncbi:FtsB family cell division protein [Terrilactibacillus laevilacticus]|uniref:Septum formation initiator family protein n=1 Tax=Terrilactibacillus laevilacticus TaxID=1380157 RepID=A0ABW5PS32_9BACI|nr:septum formation initiator family protein [Terrilactibacillus laevilacticus]
MKAARTTDVRHIRSEYVQSQEVYEKFRKKRRKGLMRRLVAFGIVLTVIVGFLTSIISSKSDQIDSKLTQKEHLEQKLRASKEDEKALKHNIRLLHDKDYIGDIARRDFLLSKKGEIIFSKLDIDSH